MLHVKWEFRDRSNKCLSNCGTLLFLDTSSLLLCMLRRKNDNHRWHYWAFTMCQAQWQVYNLTSFFLDPWVVGTCVTTTLQRVTLRLWKAGILVLPLTCHEQVSGKTGIWTQSFQSLAFDIWAIMPSLNSFHGNMFYGIHLRFWWLCLNNNSVFILIFAIFCKW